MFTSDEKEVLKTIQAYCNTVRGIDGGRYTTVIVPIPLFQKLFGLSGIEPIEEQKK